MAMARLFVLFLPIVLYLVIIRMLILAVKVRFKYNLALRDRIKKWIKIGGGILFIPLLLLYLSYLFSLAIDDHYNVKRGTFLWLVTMDNRTITSFPTIAVQGEVSYNSIGGDAPSISTGWEIEYASEASKSALTQEILVYLEQRGFELEEVGETQYYWTGKNKKNDMNQLYSGSNKKGESLDLMIQSFGVNSHRIECSIVY